jgi:hypothetical protein
MIASLTVAVLGALAAVRVGALPGGVSAQARAQAQAPISLADPIAGQPRLRFDKKGSFKIVSFHDLHYGEVRAITTPTGTIHVTDGMTEGGGHPLGSRARRQVEQCDAKTAGL